MNTAQELFEHLRDARPATPRHSKPAQVKQAPVQVRAVRFTVELPELGGTVELSPWVGVEPVYCVRCGAAREQRREHLKNKPSKVWIHVAPCNCRGMR